MEITLKSAYDFKGLKDIYNICNDYLLQSALEKGIAGPAEFSPGQWKNRLLDLSFEIFRFSGVLYSDRKYIYDKQKVLSIYLYVYRPLCYEYNKIIYLNDFITLVGISNQTIYNFGTIDYVINPYIYNDNKNRNSNSNGIGENGNRAAVDFAKLINSDSECALSDAMISDKGNPLRYLSILNFRHGWNNSEKIQAQGKPLTLAEIRQSIGLLSAGDGQNPEKSDNPHKIQQNKPKVSEK